MNNKEWLNELLRKYQAAIANVFVLHWNVADLVDGNSTLENCLFRSPLFNDKIIIKYNRSAGITFPRDAELRPDEDDILGEFAPIDEGEARAIWGLDEDIPIPREPGTALYLIETLLKCSRETPDRMRVPQFALYIDYAETLIPNGDISSMSPEDRTILTTLQRWAKEPEIMNLGTPIILVTENLTDIHANLRSPSAQIEAIQVPLPTYEQRFEYINQLLEAERFQETVTLEIGIEEMTRLTGMLKRIHIEDMFLRAEDLQIPLTRDLVKERKTEILASEFSEVLESPDLEIYNENMISVPDYIKKFFQKNLIDPVRSGNLRRVPAGILLSGPSGTGKTLLVRVVSKLSGLNNVDLNIAKITDKWVGSSERNLEKAFTCIEALAPVIVTIDEIDQMGFLREGGDSSGVSSRLFRRLLEFMSDPKLRGQVIFIGLSNRPDLMDPALKRPGRFDKKIPVLAPTANERIGIVQTLLDRYLREEELDNISEEEYKKIAVGTEGYTGAELEALVLKAIEVSEDNECKTGWEQIEYALDVYRPTTQDIEKMTRLAIAECNDLDLLPPEWRERIKQERSQKNQQPLYMPRRRG